MNSSPLRRRVLLMRHGEVTYFDAARPPLHHTEVPLSAAGQAQADAARAELASTAIDRVVTSPLLRTRETAAIVCRDRQLPRDEQEALAEIRPGAIHEIPPERLPQAMREAFHASLDRATRFLDGETLGELVDRVIPCFDSLLANPHWQTLLIVAHGGVNRAILTYALGSGVAGFGRLEQDPACLNVIDVDPQRRLLVRLVNYTPYNQVKIGPRSTTMEQLFDEFQRFQREQR